MDNFFYQNNRPQLEGEPVTATAVVTGIVKLAPKIVDAVKKLANFFKGLVNNDNGVIAARNNFFYYIIARFSNFGGTRSWDGIGNTPTGKVIINPILNHFKIGDRDIPNAKVFGNYDAEYERVAQAMATYLAMYESNKLDSFYGYVSQKQKIDHAFLNATLGLNTWNGMNLLRDVPAFNQQQLDLAFDNANKVILGDSTTTTSPTGAQTYQVVRDAAGNLLQPGTPEYQAAVQQPPAPQQAGAGNALVWVLGIAVALGIAAVASAPKPASKKEAA
jgi:hypothetical protein